MTELQTLANIASFAPAVYKGILGIKQSKEAKALNPVRPVYTIPTAVNQQVDVYRGLANQSTLPGQAIMEDQLNQAVSSGISGLREGAGSAQELIAGANNLAGGQMRSLNDLAIAAANMQRQAQGQYAQSLGTLGQYQERAFNINQMIPYMNEVAKKEALKAAANQNIYGALGEASGTLNEVAAQQEDKMNSLAQLAALGVI